MLLDLELGLSLLASIIPSLVLLHCFYRADNSPVPLPVLRTTFLLAVLIVLPDYLLGNWHHRLRPEISDPLGAALYVALLVAAVPEEGGKFLVLRLYSARQPGFREPMDGVVCGAFAALGFATVENAQHLGDGALTMTVIRGLTAIPAHACFGAIQGYYLGQGWFRGRPRWVTLWGLFVAVLLHALYDFPLLALRNEELHGGLRAGTPTELAWRYGLSTLFVLTLAMEGFWTYRIVRRLRQEQIDRIRSQTDGSDTASSV
ncbi:MAG: hypothetical protein JWN86_1344 [Planctomycetota bacterium]|nr:hypothetical protein [Planctomycetota bacterium]